MLSLPLSDGSLAGLDEGLLLRLDLLDVDDVVVVLLQLYLVPHHLHTQEQGYSQQGSRKGAYFCFYHAYVFTKSYV